MKPSHIALGFLGLSVCMVLGAVALIMLPGRGVGIVEDLSGPLQTEATTTSVAISAEPLTITEPFLTSFQEILDSGNSYGCHYLTYEEDTEITGTVFVSNGQARGTFVAALPGTTEAMLWYFLMTPTQNAVWFVFPESAPEEFRGRAYLSIEHDPALMREGKQDMIRDLSDLYGCVPWEFDDGFFTLPQDISYITEEEVGAFDERHNY